MMGGIIFSVLVLMIVSVVLLGVFAVNIVASIRFALEERRAAAALKAGCVGCQGGSLIIASDEEVTALCRQHWSRRSEILQLEHNTLGVADSSFATPTIKLTNPTRVEGNRSDGV